MKKKLLFVFALALLAPWAASAQVRTVVVGNWSGTTSSAYGGFHNTAKYSWTQTLYTQSEMGAAGWIHAIILDNRSTASNVADSVKIYLGHTTMTTHPTAAVSTWVPQSDLTQVWSRTNYTFPAEVGQLVIEFDQPYYYNGNGSLALVVSKAAQATNTNTKFGYVSTTASMKYTGSTTESYCHFPTVAGTNSTYKENIMFVMTTNQDDDYCLPLQGLHLASATTSSVTVAWNGETGVTYEIGYVDATSVNGISSITPVTVSDTFYTVSGLDENTVYRLYVRRQCSNGAYSGWDSINARTLMTPMYPPLTFTFDDPDDDDSWAIANSVNGWYIDSLGDRRVMFISNDSGAHNTYSHTTGYSWAWVDVNFSETGVYRVGFDWKAQGEGNYDYLRVALTPTSEIFSPVYTDNPIANNFRTLLPEGWINISNTPDGQYKLNLDSTWNHFTGELNITDSLLGNYHLAIIWVNDGSGGTQPPAAIDNFVLEATSCFAADSCVIDSTTLTATTADLTIYHPSSSSFVVYWRKYGASLYNIMEVEGTVASFTDLMPGTTYEGLVYTVCGSDTSYGYSRFQFTMPCGVLEMPVALDAEHYWKGTTSAPVLDCWNFVNGESSTYSWRYNSTAANVHSGSNTYYYYGTTSGTFNDWMITPVINFTAASEITLWVKTTSATTTNLYHGRFAIYATNADMADSTNPTYFSQLTISGENVTNNRVDFVGNTWQMITVQLPETLVGEHRLAFVVNSQSYSFYMDDVNIHEINSCPSAFDVAIPDSTILSDGAVVVWSDSLYINSYRVNYWAENAGPEDTLFVIAPDTAVTLENLTPNTRYYVTVTTVCTSGEAYSTYPVSFRTNCLPVATDELPYIEDFEAYGTGSASPISSCWYKATNYSSTAYPYPYGSSTVRGTRSLYFNGTTANIYSYAVLPTFESPLSNLMVEFDLKRYSSTTNTYHSVMVVGVMSDPSDITTIDTLRVIDMTPLPVNTASRYRLSLAGYTGTGRLVFYAPAMGTSQYNPIYLDSVVVKLAPECVWPENLTIDSVAAHDINLSWTGTASQYEMQADTTENFSTPVSVLVSTNEGTITGLQDYKTYYVRVRSLCTNDSSDWSEMAVTHTMMDCGPNSFNVIDTIGQGTSTSTSVPFAPGSTYRLGYSQHIFTAQEMNAMGLQSNNRIHSIKLHSGTTGGTIRQAKVYMKEVSLNEFSTSPANDTVDRATMTLVYSGDLVLTASSWNEITFDTPFIYSGGSNLLIMFAHDTNTTSSSSFYYTASGYTSAYGYRSNTGSSLSVTRTTSRPNIIFNICTEVPNCQRPADVVANASDTEISLSWTGEANSYEVVIDTTSIDPATATARPVTGTTTTFTGLTPTTTYYYYVRGFCDGGQASEWSIEGSATTACAAKSLPYTEDFESYASGSTNPIDPCWTKGTNNTTAYPYPYNTNAVTGYRSLYFYAYNSTSTKYYSYAALPLMEDSVKNLSLSFNVRRYSTTTDSYTSRLVIGVMTNPSDISTFEPMDTLDLKDAPSLSIHGYEYLFENYTGEGRYIAIYDAVPPCYGTSTTCYSYAYVDDILVDRIPTCRRPNNVALGDVSETSATIHWTGSAPAYEIEYGLQGFNLGSGIRVNSNNDSVVLTGLTQGHTYEVYVRGRCSATDSSIWSFPYTFVTVCGRNILPYTEDFERYGSGSAYAIDPCWVKGTNTTTAYPYPYSSNAVNGERSLYFYAFNGSSSQYYSYAALPLMQDSVKNLMLRFNVRRYSTVSNTNTTRLVIGVMTNPNDIATFTPMDTLNLFDAAASSVHGYEYYFNHYTGNGEYIAIYDAVPPLYGSGTSCYSYAYVDDIVVDNIPSCYRPLHVTVDNIGQSTATVHWTGNAPSYEIEYGLEGFARGTGITVTSTTDSVDLTGLINSAKYDVYVRGLCSATSASNWSFVESFSTVCGLNALPITMTFEDEATGTAAPMPGCWVRWNNNMTATYGYYPYVYNSSANAHSGSNSAYFYLPTTTGYPTDDMLISPEIDTTEFPMDIVEAVFWAKRSTYAVNLIVGLVSDVDNPSTSFTAVDTIALTNTYAEYSVPFANYSGHGNRVAFRGVQSGSSSQYIYIDDIIISEISACERSYGLQAYDATNNSVTLEWEDSIGSTQWVVNYAIDSVSTWSTVTANSNPFTLTGLNANTLYRYRVAPICADGQVADWSRETVRFTTSQVPATVPYSYDFETAAEWNNWQTSSNNNVNWYRGNVAQHNSTYAAYISADGGATHSWNMTAATNAVAYRDIDFGPDVHGFQLEFDAYLGGTTDGHNYEGLSVFLVDPAIPVTSVSTNITSPWGNVNNVELYTMRHDTTWGHYTVYLDGVSGVKRVVFYHFNQNTASSHPYDNNPSAFDNVSVTIQPCERPVALSTTPLSPYRTAVDWVGDDSATYQVRYRKTNENGYTYRTVTGTSITLTGLTPSASYYWWVRKVCTLTETDTLLSSWSVRDAFDAPCVSVSVADTLREGFENVNEHGTLYSATDGKMPNCWDSWSSNNATVYPHVTDSGSYSYWVEGNAALTMTSAGSSTNYGTNSYAVLPEIAEPTNSLTLAFWFCMESTSSGELTVGYLTGSDYEHDFVAVKTMVPGANAAHDGNGLQLSRGQRDTVSFDSVPAGNYRLAFRWTKESTFYSVCIDDVAVWTSAPACVAPVIDTIEATDATIAFSWLGTAQTYEVAFAEGEWDDPDSTIAVTGTSFTFTGLQAETRYTIGVRAACSEGVYSNWTLNSITTAEHPCAVPTGLTASNITYTSATLGWTEGEPGQDEWQVHLYGEGLDTIFVSNTLTYDFNGLAHGVTYNFQVRAICTVNRISNWSTSAEFTTIACEGVTNVTVGSVTANSAVISWTAPTGATRFVVNYGLQGFDQGTGSFDTVENATSCTLSGLTANSPYDVYVRTLCEGGTASAWSSVVNFTTSRSTGIDDVNAANVSLYPNPASSTVTLKGIEGKATVTVVDMNGRKAGEWTVNEGELTIDVTDMAQGAYFVRIVGEQVNAIRKLIVR